MTFNIISLLIGLLILIFGIYYFVKEKQDKESRVIYGITIGVGLIIILAIIIRIILIGF